MKFEYKQFFLFFLLQILLHAGSCTFNNTNYCNQNGYVNLPLSNLESTYSNNENDNFYFLISPYNTLYLQLPQHENFTFSINKSPSCYSNEFKSIPYSPNLNISNDDIITRPFFLTITKKFESQYNGDYSFSWMSSDDFCNNAIDLSLLSSPYTISLFPIDFSYNHRPQSFFKKFRYGGFSSGFYVDVPIGSTFTTYFINSSSNFQTTLSLNFLGNCTFNENNNIEHKISHGIFPIDVTDQPYHSLSFSPSNITLFSSLDSRFTSFLNTLKIKEDFQRLYLSISSDNINILENPQAFLYFEILNENNTSECNIASNIKCPPIIGKPWLTRYSDSSFLCFSSINDHPECSFDRTWNYNFSLNSYPSVPLSTVENSIIQFNPFLSCVEISISTISTYIAPFSSFSINVHSFCSDIEDDTINYHQQTITTSEYFIDNFQFNLQQNLPSPHELNAFSFYLSGNLDSSTQNSIESLYQNSFETSIPIGRSYTSSWSSNTYLYLFGGVVFNNTHTGYSNDLWSYNLHSNLWNWIQGDNNTIILSSPVNIDSTPKSNILNSFIIYSSENNKSSWFCNSIWPFPSAYSTSCQIDGYFYLFGGHIPNVGLSNDLLRYDKNNNQWCVNVPNHLNYTGHLPLSIDDSFTPFSYFPTNYGWDNINIGQISPRYYSSGTQYDKYLFVFGGIGFENTTSVTGHLNDLWAFDIQSNVWYWLSGSSNINNNGDYPSEYYNVGIPPSRSSAVLWISSQNNYQNPKIYLFGGESQLGTLNDFWSISLSTLEWEWIGGSNTVNSPGYYSSEYSHFSSSFYPSSRSNVGYCNFDDDSQMMLVGGKNTNSELFNDIWSFDSHTNTWGWIGGSSSSSLSNVINSNEYSSSFGSISSRISPTIWCENNQLYVFGGSIFNSSEPEPFSSFNDMWTFPSHTILPQKPFIVYIKPSLSTSDILPLDFTLTFSYPILSSSLSTEIIDINGCVSCSITSITPNDYFDGGNSTFTVSINNLLNHETISLSLPFFSLFSITSSLPFLSSSLLSSNTETSSYHISVSSLLLEEINWTTDRLLLSWTANSPTACDSFSAWQIQFIYGTCSSVSNCGTQTYGNGITTILTRETSSCQFRGVSTDDNYFQVSITELCTDSNYNSYPVISNIASVKPFLNIVTLYSNHPFNSSRTAVGAIGDTVYLKFTCVEPLKLSSINCKIDGTTRTTFETGETNEYYCSVLMEENQYIGSLSIQIDYKDVLNRAGDRVKGTTDGSLVIADTTKPSIGSHSITSNHSSDSNLAMIGSLVCVSFSSDESVSSLPVVTIASYNASVSSTGNLDFIGCYQIKEGDYNGFITYTIDLYDSSDNAADTVTQLSGIFVDSIKPTITELVISSNRPGDPNHAKIGDIITLTFKVSETLLSDPIVSILGYQTVVDYDWGAGEYTASYILQENDIDGNVTFKIEFTDATGNPAIPITSFNDQYIDADCVFPVIGILNITSNHDGNDNIAIIGDTISVFFNSSENLLEIPKISIFGQSHILVQHSLNLYSISIQLIENNLSTPFSIELSNIFDEIGNNANNITLNSTLYIDTKRPTLTSIHLFSNHIGNTSIGAIGDLVYLSFNISETFSSIDISIQGITPDPILPPSPGFTHTFSIQISENNIAGDIFFSITLTDENGNIGIEKTAVTDSSFVLVDVFYPYVTSSTFNCGETIKEKAFYNLTFEEPYFYNLTIQGNNTLYNITVQGNSTFYNVTFQENTTTTIIDNICSIGDIIFLNFTVSERLSVSPIIFINNISFQSILLDEENNSYFASYILQENDINGIFSYNISICDYSQNCITNISSSESTLFFDTTRPIVYNFSMKSKNKNDESIAGIGDEICIKFKSTKSIKNAIITFVNTSVYAIYSDVSDDIIGCHTLSDNEVNGYVPFSIEITDINGNKGLKFDNTNINEDDFIIADTIRPELTIVLIASDYEGDESLAAIGSSIFITCFNEELNIIPNITITGHIAAVTSTHFPGQFIASYTLKEDDVDGTIPFTIDFKDDFLNDGITVTSTTDGSSIQGDCVIPILEEISIASTNPNNSLAGIDNDIIITVTASEEINFDKVIIGNVTTQVTSGNNPYFLALTVTNSIYNGMAWFSISFSDLVGNKGVTATKVYDNSFVLVDSEPPQFDNCPSNIIVPTDASQSIAFVTWGNVTVSDNLDPNPIITVTSIPSTGLGPGCFFPLGITSIRYHVVDVHGNTNNMCLFTVSVQDHEPPRYHNCPNDIITIPNLHKEYATVFWVLPTSTDNTGVSPSFDQESYPIDGLGSGSNFDIGVTLIKYKFIDIFGNVNDSCIFRIGVIDEKSDPFSCPEDIYIVLPHNENNKVINWNMVMGIDAYIGFFDPVLISSPIDGLASGSQFPIAIHNLQYSYPHFQNVTLNTFTCNFTISIVCNNGTSNYDGMCKNCLANTYMPTYNYQESDCIVCPQYFVSRTGSSKCFLPPHAYSSLHYFEEDQDGYITFHISAGDEVRTDLVITLTLLPSHGTLYLPTTNSTDDINAWTIITYVPYELPTNVKTLYYVPDTEFYSPPNDLIEFFLYDGVFFSNSSALATITVTGVNDPPTMDDFLLIVDGSIEIVPIDLHAISNDIDEGLLGEIQFELLSLPQNGSVLDSESMQIIDTVPYTLSHNLGFLPNSNNKEGSVKDYAFFYVKAKDLYSSSPIATITVNIICHLPKVVNRWSSGIVCKDCPDGGICYSDGQDFPQHKFGFWNSNPSDAVFLPCEPPEACPQEAKCATGYTGRRCGQCVSNYFRLSGKCVQCPESRNLLIWVGGGVVGLIILLILFIVATKGPNLGFISIIFTYLQSLAIVAKIKLQWPGEFESLLSYLSVFNLNIELLQIECDVPTFSWVQKYIAFFCLPIVTALVMFLLWLTYCVALKVLFVLNLSILKMDWKEYSLLSRAITTARLCVKTYVLFLVFTYIAVASSIVELFDCTTLPDGQYLDADPQTKCYGDVWYKLLPIGIIGVIVYCFGIPLLFVYILINKPKTKYSRSFKNINLPTFLMADLRREFQDRKMNPNILSPQKDPESRAKHMITHHSTVVTQSSASQFQLDVWMMKYGSLVVNYCPRCYYWELIIVLRKLGISFAKIFASTFPMFQATLVTFILLLFLLLQSHFQAYQSLMLNHMEFFELLSSVLILLGGLLCYGEGSFKDESRPELRIAVGRAMIVFFALTLFLVLYSLLNGLRITYINWRASRKNPKKIIPMSPMPNEDSNKTIEMCTMELPKAHHSRSHSRYSFSTSSKHDEVVERLHAFSIETIRAKTPSPSNISILQNLSEINKNSSLEIPTSLDKKESIEDEKAIDASLQFIKEEIISVKITSPESRHTPQNHIPSNIELPSESKLPVQIDLKQNEILTDPELFSQQNHTEDTQLPNKIEPTESIEEQGDYYERVKMTPTKRRTSLPPL